MLHDDDVGGMVNEREEAGPTEAQAQPEVDDQELLHARNRHLGERLRSRGLIRDDPDHPGHEGAEKKDSAEA